MNQTLAKILFSRLASIAQSGIAAAVAWGIAKLAMLNPDLAAQVSTEAVTLFAWGALMTLINYATNHISNQALRDTIKGAIDSADPIRQNPTRQIVPLIALCLALPLLTGCAWTQAHRAQINATLDIVGQRALCVAQDVLLSAAVDAADKNFKANFLDSVAMGLRQNAGAIVTSDDVSAVVRVWSPSDAPRWQELAGGLATIAGKALDAQGKTQSADVVEKIATGLNDAAAKARISK